MSSILGGGGGKGTQDVSIPPFESQGGITPQQQDLAQYTLGQNLMGENQLFGGSGTGMSTMDTQGDTGAFRTEAKQQGQMSDTDQEAMYQLYQNDVNNEIAGMGNQDQINQQNSSSLDSLASGLGNLFGGGSGGSFG